MAYDDTLQRTDCNFYPAKSGPRLSIGNIRL